MNFYIFCLNLVVDLKELEKGRTLLLVNVESQGDKLVRVPLLPLHVAIEVLEK